MKFLYDFFISYSNNNLDIASFVVDKIEQRGYKCFIAPRNIDTGEDFASQIVHAISNSTCVLLIFSVESNKSAYVLREINSAVSRNKVIIPLRIEDFLPSEAMEFYLGPTQWLNAYPEILDMHIDCVIETAKKINVPLKRVVSPEIANLQVFDTTELLEMGYDKKRLVMKAIELDYLCIPIDKYDINDQIEGTFDDWIYSITENSDASAYLIQDDTIIGYCEAYPIEKEDFESIIEGKEMISSSKIALYALGGEFDLYISMIAIDPDKANPESVKLLFNKLYDKIKHWTQNAVCFEKIGISVYSSIIEKFVVKLGFKLVGQNKAKGKIFVTTLDEFLNNEFLKKLVDKSE